MEGNVSFYQVNLVSRITGEGGGWSFEGRGGLVLIKSERVWRGGGGGGYYVNRQAQYVRRMVLSGPRVYIICQHPYVDILGWNFIG